MCADAGAIDQRRVGGRRLRAAVLGSGNIAADLLAKLVRTPLVDCQLMAGRRDASDGLAFARSLGVATSDGGVDEILDRSDKLDVVFEATSDAAAREHWPLLRTAGVRTIDLTPSKQGVMCVPALNVEDTTGAANVSLVTCGGQAALPVMADVVDCCAASYLELVTTNPAQSLGPSSRSYIDEYIATCEMAMTSFTNVEDVKAIHVVNPAEPPMAMHNTVFALTDSCDIDALTDSLHKRVRQVQRYVPGYELIVPPTYDGQRLMVTIGVTGRGDYLPRHAGNLDIITCAAVAVAEYWATAPEPDPLGQNGSR